MNTCPSNHAYIRKISPAKAVCLDCGQWVDMKAVKENKGPLIMPPELYRLTSDTWSGWNPWPRIPLQIAEKYGWYGSVIGMDDYLVMPIFRNKLPASYSARRITNNGGNKYMLPSGRAKHVWQSDNKLVAPVLVGEGVADAAWLSEIRNSVALLGGYGELDYPFIAIMDGDVKGIEAAFHLIERQRERGLFDSQVVMLPGGDPTDYSIAMLKQLIREQTGVKL